MIEPLDFRNFGIQGNPFSDRPKIGAGLPSGLHSRLLQLRRDESRASDMDCLHSSIIIKWQIRSFPPQRNDQ